MTQPKHYSSTIAKYKNTILLLVGFMLVHATVAAQETFDRPVAKFITSFPFTLLTGGVIVLHAAIDNHPDTLNFILDTGSGGISLDSATVNSLGLTTQPSNRTIRGIAGIRKVSFTIGKTLRLPGLDVHGLDFHINDYGILTSVYGLKIDGIIGYSFLRRYIIKVNYDKLLIEVWSQGDIRYPRSGYMMRPQLHFLPIVPAYLRDATKHTAEFYFDTGAGLCFLLSEDFLRDSVVLEPGRKMTMTQGEGLGGKKVMRLTTMKEVRVGPFRFRNVPTHVFEDEFKLTNYPQLGGLIGNDLLRRFNLIINYEDKAIHLSPNSHYSEPFDYSYTGLGIYLINGQIVVEDVIPGSPGEKAGLQQGDIILGVDKNFTSNIQAYKALLQVPHTRLKIFIRRGDELMELNLRIASIR